MTIYVAGNEPDTFTTVSDIADVVQSVGQGVDIVGVARAGTLFRRRASGTITFPEPRQAAWFRCRVRPRGTGTGQIDDYFLELRDGNGDFILGLRQPANSGEVRVQWHGSSSTTLIATMPATPAADDAFTLDIQWRMTNTAAGLLEVFLDGTSVYAQTGGNLRSGGTDSIGSIVVRAIGSTTDTAENHNLHIGQMVVGLGPTFGARVQTLPIPAFGTTNDWTGSLSNITAAAPDDSTTITGTTGQETLFATDNVLPPPTDWHLEAAVLSMRARYTAGATDLRARVRIGSTTYDSVLRALPAAFGGCQFPVIGNPSLDLDVNRWTEIAMSEAEFGVKAVSDAAAISKAVLYAVTKQTRPIYTLTGHVEQTFPTVSDAGGAYNTVFIPEKDRIVFGTTRQSTTRSEAWYSDNGLATSATGSATLNIWPSNSRKGRHFYLPRTQRLLHLYLTERTSGGFNTARSDDFGVNWTLNSGLAGWAADAAWSSTLGLAVVVCGGGNIYTTTDGSSFTLRTSGTSADLYGIVWSPELQIFVAVGASGNIRTSPDGITWTARTNPLGGELMRCVAWSAPLGLFVALGGTGTAARISSPDGINWTSRGNDSGLTPNGVKWVDGLGLFLVACSGNTFTAVTDTLLQSSNGTSWTTYELNGLRLWRDIEYIPDRGMVTISQTTITSTFTTTEYGRVLFLRAVSAEPAPTVVDVEVDLESAEVEYDQVTYAPQIVAPGIVVVPAVTWDLQTYNLSTALGGSVTLFSTPPIEVKVSSTIVWGVINPGLNTGIWTPIVP